MSGCYLHASKEAVGACINCGELVCAACHKEIEGKSYCQACVDKLFGATEVIAEQAPSPVTSAAKPVPQQTEKEKVASATVVQAAKTIDPTTPSGKPVTAPEKTGVVQPRVTQSVSNLWWLLPIFLAWIGGLVAWSAVKGRAPQKARYMLFGGIGVTLLQVFMVFLIIFAAAVPGAQIPVVELKSAAPTELNIPANSTWTAIATAENGTTLQNAGISLQVPPAAVQSDTEIVVKEFTALPSEFYYAETNEPPPVAMAISDVYDVGPAGVQFDKPVQVTISYDKTLLPAGAKPEDIKMAHWDGKNWVVVGGYVDAQKGTVTVSSANFPGSVLGVTIAGGIIIGGYILYTKITGDPRAKGTAPQHVMPENDTVKEYSKKAGILQTGKWIPLEDPYHSGKLNPQVMAAPGLKRIGFKDEGSKAPNYPDYTEYVAGSDVNWTKPDAFFNNKNGNGDPRGDCTCVTSATLSMLRKMGLEAYGVDGQLKDPRNVKGIVKDVWFEHTWVEFVYQGTPYYYDNAYGIVPLQDMKDHLYVPKSITDINKGYMWNEKGQKWYQDGWWKSKLNTPAVTIKTLGSIGYINQPCIFIADPENIPPGSKIVWSISGGPNESGAVYTDVETVTHTFESTGEKTITVQYTQDNAKIAGDKVVFVVYAEPTLDILLPAPATTEYKPLDPDKPNTFTAIPKAIPPDAVYTWQIGDTEMDKGANKTALTVPAKSLKPSGEYEVSVLANWTGADGKNKWLKASKFFSVESKSLYITSDLPSYMTGKVCTEYTFTANFTNKQPGTSFEWFEDGQTIDSGKDSITHMFKNHGSPLVTIKATWQSNGNTQSTEASYSVKIGEPKITVKGPKELKEKENGTLYETYSFWIEPENIPDSASYTMDGKSISGTEFQTTMLATGIQIVRGEANWDNNDCRGQVKDSQVIMVEPPILDKITATPTPGIAGQQTAFKASGRKIPSQKCTLTWELGKGQKSQEVTSINTEVNNTYNDAGDYDVIVTLRGPGQSFIDYTKIRYHVNAGATLTLKMPESGPINKQYTFTADPTEVPKGAYYTWYINDSPEMEGTDKTIFTTAENFLNSVKVKDSNLFKFYVVATWTEKSASGATLKKSVDATAVFETLDAAPVLSIKLPAPAPNKPLDLSKEHIFYAESTGIPDSATYEWYINEQGVLKAQGKEGMEAIAPAGFFKEGDYKILVIAKWKGADSKEQWAQADAMFKVEKINISLSIIPPPDIQSNTAKENIKYYFAFNTNIPSTATFTWYSDGQEAGKGQSIGLAFPSGQHIIELKANWQDTDAAKTKHEQKADPLRFNIAAIQPPDDSGTGWHLVKIEPPMQFSEYYGPNDTQSFDNGNYTVTYPSHFNSNGPDKWQTNNFIYTKMPQYLKPDNDFKISCSINATSSLYFAADNIIESKVQPGTGVVYYVGGKIIYRCEFESSKTSVLHIMPGVPGGDKLRIRVSFFSKDTMDANGGFTQTATYIYEYR